MYDAFGRAIKESELKKREKEKEEAEAKKKKGGDGTEEGEVAESKSTGSKRLVSTAKIISKGHEREGMTYLGDDGAGLDDGANGAGAAAGVDSGDGARELSEEEQMMRLLGIGGFETTKGEAVDDNQKGVNRGAVQKKRGQREYRQYMNRLGGFNQLLNGSKSFRSTAR